MPERPEDFEGFKEYPGIQPQHPPQTRSPRVMGVKFNPAPSTARMVVVESIYYQESGTDPIQIDPIKFSRWLSGDQQPYGPRRRAAKEEWQPLWTEAIDIEPDNCRLLLIHNTEGENLQTNPTPDELAGTESKILEVCLIDNNHPDNNPSKWTPFAFLPPGEGLRLSPMNVHLYYIRVRQGGESAKYLLTVIPK